MMTSVATPARMMRRYSVVPVPISSSARESTTASAASHSTASTSDTTG